MGRLLEGEYQNEGIVLGLLNSVENDRKRSQCLIAASCARLSSTQRWGPIVPSVRLSPRYSICARVTRSAAADQSDGGCG